MIKKIDHVGIAVKDLEATLKLYEEVLGLKSTGTEVVETRLNSLFHPQVIVRLSCWSQHRRTDPSPIHCKNAEVIRTWLSGSTTWSRSRRN